MLPPTPSTRLEDLRNIWELALRQHPDVRDLAVNLQLVGESLRYRHLHDVLPDTGLSASPTLQATTIAPPIASKAASSDQAVAALSLLTGEPLVLPQQLPDTLPAILHQQAARITAASWIFVDADGQEQRFTYADMLNAAETILAGLRQAGLQPQDKVILQLGDNYAILTAFWGCVLGGFVPVIMAPPPSYAETHNDLERLLHVYRHLQQPYLLTDAVRRDSIQQLARWGDFAADRVLALEDCQTQAADTRHHVGSPDDVVFFTLTSGSTGAPKCIPLTHRNLIYRAVGVNQANAHQADDVILNWLPFDHIGSISDWHIRCVLLGCTLVYAPKEYVLREPLNWLRLLDRYRITHSWAPNFAYSLILNALAEQGRQGDWDLSCVKALLTAGEAVSPATVAAFLDGVARFGFPSHAICPAFGMAEMGSGVTYFHASAEYPLRFVSVSRASLDSPDGVVAVSAAAADAVSFTSLGPPIPGISLRIVDAHGTLLPMGTVGHFQVKGTAVANGYYQNPQANEQAFLDDGWFDTGDLGFFADGELVISGRAKEVIIINGANFANAEIEVVVESVPGVAVSFTAACAVRMPGQTAEQLAVFFVPNATTRLPQVLPAIQKTLLKTLGLMPAYLIPLQRDDIPKTAIGKIQRKPLAQRLEAGELDSTLQQVDVLLGNERTVPEWFYQRAWQPLAADSREGIMTGLHVILADRLGLADTLRGKLEALGNVCVCVSSSTHVTPQVFAHPSQPLVHVWHLLGYDAAVDEQSPSQEQAVWDACQENNLYSVLALAQALLAYTRDMPQVEPVGFSVVASHSQLVLAEDRLDATKATVPALLKSLAAEQVGLYCRHIDLPLSPLAYKTACLVAESSDRATHSGSEVAWRDGMRYIAGLQKTALAPADKGAARLAQGGLYVLTGGLGGMGVELATFLLTNYQARLLLLGQTALPVAGADVSFKTVARLATWQQLEVLALQSGGAVQYVALDVGGAHALQQAVIAAEQYWQAPLDGIFHLAGTSHEQPIANESRAGMAAILYPKLAGALAIQPLLVQRPQAFVVYSSSAAGFFGGANIAAYAAANAYLDAFAVQQRQQGLRSYSLAWSMWDDVGMSQGATVQALFAAKGYCLISSAEAMRSLLVALAQNQPSLLVGLDGGKAHVRQFRTDVQADAKELVTYCVLAEGCTTAPALPQCSTDLPVPCRMEVVDAIPRLPDGTVDFEELAQQTLPDKRYSSRYLAPRNPLEIQLATIWQEVLKKPKVGVQDNFFALGGASLQVIQCVARLNQALGLELLPGVLFAHPTLEALAQQVAGLTPSSIAEVIALRASDAPLQASFAQQRLWFLDELEAGDAYNIPVALRLCGVFDMAAFQQAFDAIIQRHEALRTQFVAGDSAPILAAFSSALIPQVDLSALPKAAREAVVLRHARADAQRPFNLATDVLLRATVLRLAADEHVLLLNLHHIAGDGWSISVLARELQTLYAACREGKPAVLPELPIQYADFAAWQRATLQGERLANLLAFWKQQLSGAPELLQLPTDFPRPEVESYQGGQQSIHIPQTVVAALQPLAQQAGATLYMTLLAAFNVLLYRYSGQDDLVVGSPVACRNRSELEPLIGFFANTLALRTQMDASASFVEVLAQVRSTAQAAFDHQDVPFEKLVEELQLTRTLAYNPLVQVLFALQNVSANEFAFAGIQSQPLDIPAERSLFDLELQLWETPNGLEGFFLYKTALFRVETVQRMAGHFLTLLSGIVAHPQQAVGHLPLLPDSERQLLLEDWSGIAAPLVVDTEPSVMGFIAAQAERTSNAVAVVDAATGQQLTYRELNTRANQLAHYLRTQGIGAEMPVGLCVERSADMLVGLLGILKAGAVYLPIDPTYPAERIHFMLEQAQVRLVLSQQAVLERVFTPQVLPADTALFALDSQWFALLQQPLDNPALVVTATQLAYLIYTSGSTGQPKGVMVEQGALASHTRTMQQQFGLGANDRVLQFASMSFDVALEQILPALISGARVVIAQPHWSLDEFTTHLQAQQVTVCDLPPAYLHQVLAHWQTQQWQALPASLRLMIVGNDVLPPETVALWREMGRGIRLLNAYGPTEATITATCHELNANAIPTCKVPIGRPLSGKTAYVLDTALQPLPIGVPGELYLGGSGVARGYWQRDDLTAERFLANPFGAGRLYRTGDLARWLPDGTLEFIGRVDHQVKLRGFRIELGEIETVLNQYPAVHEAAVIVREDQPGQKRLIAYWTAKPFADASNTDIMQHLQAALPAYMVPSICVLLEAMPQTANGKINRKALPVPTETEAANDTQYAAPTQPVEQQLADIWANVLGRESVGIHDNFFALGGDSILSLQVVSRARQQGLLFQPKQLFQYQTIAKLASVVEQLASTTTLNTQGQVSGKVELTPVQHWFFAQDFAEAQHHNLAFRAEIAAGLTPEMLTHAWQQVTLHHDALRSHFVQQNGQWQQSCAAEVGELTVEVIDLSDLSLAERQVRWEQECRRLQASLNLATGELQRMALFRLGEQQPARLFWCIHHLVVDGVSWRVLLEDLQTACVQLQQGQGIKLPAKTTAFQTWAAWLAQDAVPYVKAELAYWQGVCTNQTAILVADYPANITANTVASQAHIVRQLSAVDTRSLLQDAHQAYHTQVNDLLLTALLRAYQQRTGQSRLRLDLEGHGREVLDTPPGGVAVPAFDLSRTVGWFTSLYPLALTLQGKDAASAIKAVKEQLRAIPNRGMGYGILRYLGKADGLAGQAELCFNYLGQFEASAADTAVLRHAMLDMATQPHSPQQQRPYVWEINCLVVDGQLQVDCAYSTALHKPATVEAFADAFMSALQAVLAHCRDPQAGGYTSSDFAQAKLKQNQLDQLLNRIKVNKRK